MCQDVLEVMSIVAVMVNCALIGMSDLADRLFVGWNMTRRLIFIILLEVCCCAQLCIVNYDNDVYYCYFNDFMSISVLEVVILIRRRRIVAVLPRGACYLHKLF